MPGELEEQFRDGSWYDARIENAYVDEAGSGTPGILITWMIVDGEMAGKMIQDNHWIAEGNKVNQREAFQKALNYDIAAEDLDMIEKLIGRKASIKIKMETTKFTKGKPEPRVGRMRPIGAASSGLSPSKRIAAFFGAVTVEAPDEKEENEFKKFD